MNGLKICLKYGHFIMVGVESPAAQRAVIDKWMSPRTDARGITHLTGTCRVTGSLWAVAIEDVVMIHTIELTQHNQQQPTPFEHQVVNNSGIRWGN